MIFICGSRFFFLLFASQPISNIFSSMKFVSFPFRTCIAICLTVVMFTFYSCEDFSFRNGVNEGRIEYSISYPNIPEDSYILDLMPKTMETIFSNNNYRNDIIAGMGLFKTSIICTDKDDEIVHSVKMLNKKFASKLSSEDLANFNPSFNDIR